MDRNHFLSFSLVGAVSGILSYFTFIIFPLIGLYLAPGIVFGVAILLCINTPKLSSALPANKAFWVFMSTFAYYGAVWITLNVSGFVAWDFSAPANNYNETESILKSFYSHFVGGVVGSFLMLLGFKYNLFSISTISLLLLTLFGGILGLAFPLSVSLKSLGWALSFTIWQAGMAGAIGWVMNKNSTSA